MIHNRTRVPQIIQLLLVYDEWNLRTNAQNDNVITMDLDKSSEKGFIIY